MKDYHKTTQYLFQLQRLGIKLGLENITQLLQTLENPHERLPCIHIAGTNGKGSTAAMLEAILLKSGYKVGLYTSPHLVDFTERIRVNCQHIPREIVVSLTKQMQGIIEKIKPTFFEVTTAMAFWYFANQDVDIALIETGMGGRLDSTNVIHPLISVITPIDYDHQKYLGRNIQKIALEKAGIIKAGIPCITNNYRKSVLQVLSKKCREADTILRNVHRYSRYNILSSDIEGTNLRLEMGGYRFEAIHLNLPGLYQVENMLLAVGTVLHLNNIISVPKKAIIEGLKAVRWRGRLQLVSKNPIIIIDVSHNPAGFVSTLSFITRFFPREKIRAITSLQEDKDFRKIGKLLARHASQVWVTRLSEGKPLPPEKLVEVISREGGQASTISNFKTDILPLIFDTKNKEKVWLIIGSHYLAGEAFKNIELECFITKYTTKRNKKTK